MPKDTPTTAPACNMGFFNRLTMPFNGAVALSMTFIDTFHVFLLKFVTSFAIFSMDFVALSFTLKLILLFPPLIFAICCCIFLILLPSLSTLFFTLVTPWLVLSCNLAIISMTTVCAMFLFPLPPKLQSKNIYPKDRCLQILLKMLYCFYEVGDCCL